MCEASIGHLSGSVKSFRVLKDFSSTGKERKWAEFKAGSERLADLYRRANEVESLITDKRLGDLEHCGEYLEFALFADGGKKLKYAYFCRNRLCPMCQWRRSLKLSFRLRGALERIVTDNSAALIFATFTVKNCAGCDLSSTISDMTTSFSTVLKKSPFKGKILGYCRTIEVTFNRKDWSYHPHIHALLVVDKGYFSGCGYVKQAVWREVWAESMNLDYSPLVNVQRAELGSAAEVAKYSTKGIDSLSKVKNQKLAVEVLSVLHKALKGRRLISAGGILKTALRDFDKDLIRDDEGIVEDVNSVEVGRVIYKWTPKFGVYLEV